MEKPENGTRLRNNAGELFFYPWERQFERLISPFDEFIERQATSGIVLVVTTLAALLLANSPLGEPYGRFLHTHLSLTLGNWSLDRDLAHWVNEGLMVFFFLLVGCEIKREFLVGEMSQVRKALLPIVAAAGGMLVPALLYHLINPSGPAAHGWGIPMATDIAFCVSALVLLGRKVPAALTLFLVSLAIVDDLGAVMVIALFYTEQINLWGLALAAVALLVLGLFNLTGIRRLTPYGLAGFGLWLALLASGVHATIAGVLLALCLPARPRHDCLSFTAQMKDLVNGFGDSCLPGTNLLKNTEQYSLLKTMMGELRFAEAPLQRVENALHIPTSFLVIPLFALANAGITMDLSAFTQILSQGVTQGVLLGLVLGKFVGVSSFTWLALKTGLGKLPTGLRMAHVAGGGLLAGIGFTMSIFITELSFPGNAGYLNLAKAGIICGSLVSALAGGVWLWCLSVAGGAKKT